MFPGHGSPFKDQPYFEPKNDILVMEGVHYSSRRGTSGHLCDPAASPTWCKAPSLESEVLEKIPSNPSFSNRLAQAVQIQPAKNTGFGGRDINAASLEYNFEIKTAGQYSFYVGASAFDGGSDSFYARILGQNGQTMSGPDFVDYFLVPVAHNTWKYTGDGMPETTSIYGPPREPMMWRLGTGFFKVHIYGRELGSAIHVVTLVPSGHKTQDQQNSVESKRIHPCVLNANLGICMYDFAATPFKNQGCDTQCGKGHEILSRTVSCVREDGIAVGSTFCTNFGLATPKSSLKGAQCTDYSRCAYNWRVGSWSGWGKCNVQCGKGFMERTRAVDCLRSDGTVVGDIDCTRFGAGSKPSTFSTKTCTGTNCGRPPIPNPPPKGRQTVSRCFLVRNTGDCNISKDSKGDCEWCSSRWGFSMCRNGPC